MKLSTSDALNELGNFCGTRDVEELTQYDLSENYGLKQADVMVLFGGSIVCGGDVLAQAMRNNIAKKYIIVGGEGHTTQALRDIVHGLYPDFITHGLAESEVFCGYLKRKYQLDVDFIDTKSTNCGNNITRLLEIIEENNIQCDTIILSQDATMQRRMSAALAKYRPEMKIINYATYRVEVIGDEGNISYEKRPMGMWDIDRYSSLLMGEIVRMRDDVNGYGPNGQDYIAHVEIPIKVENAFAYLDRKNEGIIRVADHQYKNLLKN